MVSRPPRPAELDHAPTTAAQAPTTHTAGRAELEALAREFLEALDRSDHPDAQDNPVYALYQIAVDFRCTAHGYRSLYLERQGFDK